VAISPDGRWAVSGSGGSAQGGDLSAQSERSIRLWELQTGKEIRRVHGLTSRVTSLAISFDGRRILSGHHGGNMYLWNADNATMARCFDRRSRMVWAIAFSPSGSRALSGGDDRYVHVWDVRTGHRVCRLRGHHDDVTSVAFSADGHRALSGSNDKTVRLWDLVERCQVRRFKGHMMTVLGVALSPDGKLALSCGSEATIMLWDVESGRLLRSLDGHTGAVNCVAFSNDGLRAISAGADHTVRYWEIESGRELHCFYGHTDAVTSVAFSPTEPLHALSSGRDATMRLWQMPTVYVRPLSLDAIPDVPEIPDETVASLVDKLTQFPILEPPQQDELVRVLQQRFVQPRALVKHLFAQGWLTSFQVQQLAAERHDSLVMGPYTVIDLLGEGGMGEVFKARRIGSRDIVVLKVIRPDLMADQAIAKQFLWEIQALSHLSHPNIIKTFGAFKADDRHFYTMEFIEGTDLAKLLQQSGPLPVWQACSYIRQAALGLEHAHEHCLIHRDIKPANLLLTLPSSQDGPQFSQHGRSTMIRGAVVKIIDWGLADLRPPAGHQNSASFLPEGEMVGTADYLAPEQARDSRAASIQSDIYSLGCTLYHLLAGQPPFPGGSLMQKLFKHQQSEPKPIQEIRTDVPTAVLPILQKMMAKKTSDRFRTPAMVAAALAPFCGAGDAKQTGLR
jgi:serine/threonine-protein kinase